MISQVAALQSQIITREVQLDALRTSSTDQNPDVIRLNSEIGSLRGQLRGLEREQKGRKPGDISLTSRSLPQDQVAVQRKQRDVQYHTLIFDLIARQLDIFSEDNADLLLEIAEYRERWRRASRERAEEAYGEEQDRVDWAAEALSALCDQYALSLDEETEAEYRRAFTKAVRKRLPAIADEFEAQTDTGR